MLLRLYNKNNNPKDLEEVIRVLEEGGLIIYPTDTMYAIGCHGLKERAIERICKLKNIDPRKNNLSIICYDLSNISEYAKVDNSTFKLMKRNLPGPFTFILNTGNRLPKIFKNRKEVGIRVPDNNIIREICHILKAPIMTTTHGSIRYIYHLVVCSDKNSMKNLYFFYCSRGTGRSFDKVPHFIRPEQ